ncbi:NPCBM/NEW2 domain-containing protein [Streptomyces sp. NPDC091272]|uniref:NPCBM/NEW2 domain-containing protein n=1 Tax=Streptomyces sp. NPDC091272 TaxID=3365981 RepID=UPI0038235551
MRRTPTRPTAPTPPSAHLRARRVAGALTAALLCAAGLAAPAAVAAPAPARQPAPAPVPGPTERPKLPDGLALTPPMGFNNWNSTHCRAEFNEAMVKGIADLFVEKGLKAAGYEYVNLDDCWAKPERDAAGKLVPDPVRFPQGIKAVADYVHAKGLKFGLYSSAGTRTCDSVGMPGGLNHEYSDAEQFAGWGVDYLKYDNCNNQGVDHMLRYTTMRDALKAASAKTGRPILYSLCEWGSYRPWEWGKDVGHMWRTTGDINDSWGSMLSIMKQNLPLAKYAGPGGWNDPDMLEVGNGGMTGTEYRTHFSMWSIMAAPLLIGSDLRKATPETFEILSNREVIAVDQDRLGKQGAVVSSEGGRWVVAKEMADGSRAVALFNETGSPQRVATTAGSVGLPAATGYRVRDLWRKTTGHTAGTLAATVPAHGTVLLRVSADERWATLPPVVEAGTDTAAPTEVGHGAELVSTVADLGRTSAFGLSVRLTGPAGWKIRATTPSSTPELPGGERLRTGWSAVAPPGTGPGSYGLTLTASYRSAAGQRLTTTVPAAVRFAVAPPAGVSYASDLGTLSSANGWGPIEKDLSNGEEPAGDGRPLTVGGQVFTKGLGTHAASEAEYYTGGKCATFTARVGLDDESGDRGTAVFEVWADGRKAASTGVLDNSSAAQAVSADVSGAQTVRLVVTDGGDGVDHDHADWGDAKLNC